MISHFKSTVDEWDGIENELFPVFAGIFNVPGHVSCRECVNWNLKQGCHNNFRIHLDRGINSLQVHSTWNLCIFMTCTVGCNAILGIMYNIKELSKYKGMLYFFSSCQQNPFQPCIPPA